MSKDDAIKAMQEGKKVAHKWFSADEWVTINCGMFQFEDGCRCRFTEFWCHRDEDSWLKDWSIFK